MIRLSKSCLGQQEKKAVNRVISNAYLGMGPEVKNFEKEIKEYLNTESSIIAVSSGTAALHISLQACGIGYGDEVLVSNYTMVATGNAARFLGLTVKDFSATVGWNEQFTTLTINLVTDRESVISP